MMHLFWVSLCSLLPHLTLCAPQRCAVHESSSSGHVSPLLESLRCQNDYESYVHCSWREDRNTTLQLWLHKEANRTLCVPYQPTGQHGTVQCRIQTRTWAIGIKHTFFFLKNETPTVCSSAAHKPVHLSQLLRALPPVNLSTRDTGAGGRWIRWYCPYRSSSSLANSIVYQLSYRPVTHDNWTTENVSDTNKVLDKTQLLPGHRYEAKVRTRASVGQWSHWSPVVTWQTRDDTGRPPILHCVLVRETEVTCSWETSRELAHFISYQLTCRQNQTAPSERCCVNLTVRPELGGTVLRYSCSLTVANPAHLLLELLPTHNAKTFDSTRHICPKQPQELNVKERGHNWVVEWTKPSTPLNLYYQVCYCRTHQQEPCKCVNTSALHQIIPGELLVPSQDYEVRVRSLVEPGEGSKFEGIPSEWTSAEKWTSHPATWSVTDVVYALIGVFVAVLFFVFYCAFPACQRRLVLWVDSVPSPGKSKILSEIKSATSQPLVQSVDTSTCKVLHFDAVSTCSSNASLWPMKETDKAALEPDEGVWNCDDSKVQSSDTSSMSFSGPYIFCQTKAVKRSAGAQCEEEVKEENASLDDSLSPGHFALFGEGYVRLPSRAVSRSTQDLVSHSDAEQDLRCLDAMMGKMSVQHDLSGAASRDQPPAYTAEPFSPWPPGGHMQASGYCFLPQPK